MKLLHTSDWHLGITLSDKSRKAEMVAFFDFLLEAIEENGVDTLIVAGDIYDSATPGNEAEKMYFDFLRRLHKSCCKDVVIIAGNHDSIYKLSASKEILQLLDIHVYSSVCDVEPLVLEGRAIILPVAFPREQELISAISGESIEESLDRRKVAINKVYASLLSKAEAINEAREVKLPIIATGHLAVSGANLEGEVDKSLYIGGLGVIDTTAFSDKLSYVALGHIHKPQALSKNGAIRYSGSPIPMTFDEARYPKSVVLATCQYEKPTEVKLLEIPRTKELITLKGTVEEVKAELTKLATSDKKLGGWVSLQLTNSYGNANIKTEAQEILKDSNWEIVIVKNLGQTSQIQSEEASLVPLSDITEEEVFKKLLVEQECPEENQPELLELFKIVVNQVKIGETDEN